MKRTEPNLHGRYYVFPILKERCHFLHKRSLFSFSSQAEANPGKYCGPGVDLYGRSGALLINKKTNDTSNL